MYRLLRMIECVKRSGIFYADGEDDDSRTPRMDTEHFYELIEKCQSFVFPCPKTVGEAPDMVDEDGNFVYRTLDAAPFPVFSIEIQGGDISVPFMLDSMSGRSVRTHCILAFECEPKKFKYYVHGTIEEHPHVDGDDLLSKMSNAMSTRTVINSNECVYFVGSFDAIVEQFVDRINSQTVGSEHVRERVRIGTGKTKRTHTIRRICHVRPKRLATQGAPGLFGHPIEWTHRWWVRGHWREHLGGLGKDREGNYCVADWTWVKEHEKGPEAAPLIKKVRLVG